MRKQKVIEEGLQQTQTPAEADVVTSGPPVGGPPADARPTRRRRWRFVLGMLVVAWTLVTAVVALAWFEYGRLSRDIVSANRRVPKPVAQAVHPNGSTATNPQTILVMGVDQRNRPAGTAVLVRTNPSAHSLGLLTIPTTVQITPAETLLEIGDTHGSAALIRALDRVTGGRINHVAQINLAHLSHIVQLLGGIHIVNHARFAYRTASGATRSFPAGPITLDGAQVTAYLHPLDRAARTTIPRGHGHRAALRQARQLARQAAHTTIHDRELAVMHGTLAAMLRSASLTSVSRLANIVADSVSTDLSTDAVLGLALTRLDSSTLTDCRLPATSSISSGEGQRILTGFLSSASQGSACVSHHLHTPVPSVVAQVVTSVVAHESRAWLETLVVASVAIWCLLLVTFLITSPRLHMAAVTAGGGLVKVSRRLQRPRRTSYTPAPPRDRHLPGLPFRGRAKSYAPKRRWKLNLPRPSLPFRRDSGSYTPTIPRDRRLPNVAFRNRPNPTYTPVAPRQFGRPSASAANALIMLSVPASIGIGIIVARVLS